MKNIRVTLLLIAIGLSLNLFAKEFPRATKSEGKINDVQTVIAKYIKALGGEEKIRSIKNASMIAEANFQGQTIEIRTISDSEGGRLMQSTAVGGNVMQKTIFANGKGEMQVMGQTQELPESSLSVIKSQTFLIPEMHYQEIGFETSFLGEEEVEGERAYKLEVKTPEGNVMHEYYAVDSGLKLKSSSAGAGDVVYSDYQEVDGIVYPRLLTIKNPMLPVALEAKIISLKFNQTLLDSDFQ